MAWQVAAAMGANMLGSVLSAGAARDAANTARDANMAINKENQALQKEFAQNGIKWKVEDAQRAGIHPLAALGAQTHSFNPTSIGVQADNSTADMYQNMGQDMSRAISATQTKEEQAYSAAMKVESLRNAQLQNTLLESQIHSLQKPPIGLPSPMGNSIDGQGDANINIKPAEITSSRAGVPQQEAGAVNDYGFVRTKSGYAIVPSKDAKERIEDQFIPELMWAVRNQVMPNFSGGPTPPDPRAYPIPEGARKRGANQWRWNILTQEFRPHTGKYFVD